MKDEVKQKERVFRNQLALPLLVRPVQTRQPEGNAGEAERHIHPLSTVAGDVSATCSHYQVGNCLRLSAPLTEMLRWNEHTCLRLNKSADGSDRTHHINQYSHMKVISLRSMSKCLCRTSPKSWPRIIRSNWNQKYQNATFLLWGSETFMGWVGCDVGTRKATLITVARRQGQSERLVLHSEVNYEQWDLTCGGSGLWRWTSMDNLGRANNEVINRLHPMPPDQSGECRDSNHWFSPWPWMFCGACLETANYAHQYGRV